MLSNMVFNRQELEDHVLGLDAIIARGLDDLRKKSSELERKVERIEARQVEFMNMVYDYLEVEPTYEPSKTYLKKKTNVSRKDPKSSK